MRFPQCVDQSSRSEVRTITGAGTRSASAATRGVDRVLAPVWPSCLPKPLWGQGIHTAAWFPLAAGEYSLQTRQISLSAAPGGRFRPCRPSLAECSVSGVAGLLRLDCWPDEAGCRASASGSFGESARWRSQAEPELIRRARAVATTLARLRLDRLTEGSFPVVLFGVCQLDPVMLKRAEAAAAGAVDRTDCSELTGVRIRLALALSARSDPPLVRSFAHDEFG